MGSSDPRDSFLTETFRRHLVGSRPEFTQSGFICKGNGRERTRHLVDQLKFIVDAISQLYPVELHIAGDGSLKDLVTSWHGKDGIHFHGFVPSDRMVLLYEKIDCLLLPSMWKENFPGVAVQAIMTGAPVIGFDSGGISEIIEDGKSGFLAARGDFKGLACAVIKLIESPNLLNEMSKAALERSKQYDPKYLSAKMIEILSDFLKNGNSKALHA